MVGAKVKVLRSVTTKELLAEPLKRYLSRCMLAAHADVAQPGRVPIDTGHLRNSMSPGGGATMVDPSDVPQWAAVGTNVEPYPGVLEASAKHHYADGPSKGNPTKGWLSDTIPNVADEVAKFQQQLAADIKGTWDG